MPNSAPEHFVRLADHLPEIEIDLKYATTDNFTGAPLVGYEQLGCWLTRQAVVALAGVVEQLRPLNLGLKVFDSYRPQRAVDGLLSWSSSAETSLLRARFHPNLTKSELFERGYLMAHSSHSRGSTVDLTIIDLESGQELEMGTEFDYFGESSWGMNRGVSAQARANRMLLASLMVQAGFEVFPQEWWHFTLADEPYSNSYFDWVPAACSEVA